ncbi:unnamed protein product, partial [Adineta steineri]
TIGQRDDNLNEEYYRTHIYSHISSLSPHSETFLHFGLLKPFNDHLNFDCDILFNELTVVKPMLQKNL